MGKISKYNSIAISLIVDDPLGRASDIVRNLCNTIRFVGRRWDGMHCRSVLPTIRFHTEFLWGQEEDCDRDS